MVDISNGIARSEGSCRSAKDEDEDEDVDLAAGPMRSLIALMAATKVVVDPIVVGADSLGIEIVRELEPYVQADLTPAQALQTATIVPTRLVGADTRTGSATVGKLADLVLVDGDPSQRIGDIRKSLWVVSAGRSTNADTLRQAAGFSRRPKQRCLPSGDSLPTPGAQPCSAGARPLPGRRRASGRCL